MLLPSSTAIGYRELSATRKIISKIVVAKILSICMHRIIISNKHRKSRKDNWIHSRSFQSNLFVFSIIVGIVTRSQKYIYLPFRRFTVYHEVAREFYSFGFHVFMASLDFTASFKEKKMCTGCEDFYPDLVVFVQVQEHHNTCKSGDL